MRTQIALLVLASISLSTATHETKPLSVKDFDRDVNSTGGYMKYYVPEIMLNWHDARQDCIDRGMQLIVLDTQAKNDYMSNQMSGIPEAFWVGGTDLNSTGTFYWDRTKQPFGYTSWLSGEPNNIGEERCVQMKINDHLWNNNLCDSVITKFVCEQLD